MGTEYEVRVWHYEKINDDYLSGYRQYWHGDNLDEALQKMKEAKKEGYQCIYLVWRP